MADTTDFAPEFDAPLEYMRRTRDYYLALGYDNPYRWAHYTDAPFTPLRKPLKDSTLALITTAAPYQPDKGDQARSTTPAPSSTASIRATPRRITTRASATSATTASTPRRRTRTLGSLCR
jgi:hypothetical protein